MLRGVFYGVETTMPPMHKTKIHALLPHHCLPPTRDAFAQEHSQAHTMHTHGNTSIPKKLFCWLHLSTCSLSVVYLLNFLVLCVSVVFFFIIFIIFIIFLASFDDVDQSCQQEVFGLQEAKAETLAQAFSIILYICIYSRPYR